MIEKLSVREIKLEDVPLVVSYWKNSSAEYLQSMGAEISKLPSTAELTKMLERQVNLPMVQKDSYALIWELDNLPVGHCNVNQIEFGKQANMHLHLWQSNTRQKGMGNQLVNLSIPYFFENLALEVLICEPYSLNPAPNRALEKLKFEFDKKYTTIPGSLNFEQEVNRWIMTRQEYLRLFL